MNRTRLSAAIAVAVVAAAAFVAVATVRPPAPAGEAAPPDAFSAARAVARLERIAARPHPVGSNENAVVRDEVVAQLRDLGLDPQVQETTAVISRFAAAGTVRNVVARIPGTGNTKAVMLVAHYDSVAAGPGAGDDGSGVATILEAVRAVEAGPPLRNDLIVLITDGEEAGLLGAAGFVADHPWAKDAGVVLNFEARGSSGPSFMFETSAENGWLVSEFAKVAPHPAGSSLTYSVYKYLPNDTDMSIFKEAGLAGLNFAFIGDVRNYHTPHDDLAHLDRGSLQQHGEYAVSLARHFGGLDLGSVRAPDAVYFTPVGSWMVTYPGALVLPLAALAAVVFVVAAALGVRRGGATVGSIAAGFVAVLANALATAALGQLALALARRLHGGVVPPGDVEGSGLYLGAFVALAWFVALAVFLLFRRRFSAIGLALGALLWWTALAAVASVLLPGGSYVFVWPAVFGSAGLAVALLARGTETPTGLLALAAFGVPATLLLAALVDTLHMAFGLDAIGAPVILVVLGMATWVLAAQFEAVTAAWRWKPALAALAVFAALFAAGVATVRYDAANPMRSNVGYLLDADTGAARWASYDAGGPNAWSAKYLTGAPERSPLPDFYPTRPAVAYLNHEATAAEVPAPEVALLSDATNGAVRSVRLRVASPGGTRGAVVFLPGAQVTAASANGKAIDATLAGARFRAANGWGLVYVDVPPEGIELALDVSATAPLRVRVILSSRGLPDLVVAPRPPDVMPVGSGDQTLVAKTFEF